MAYENLRVATKASRASQRTTDLGGTGYLMIYSGTQPVSPDVTVPSGNLLCALPLSATAGVTSYGVQSVGIAAGGSGGTNGTQTVTGTTGTGTKFTASVTVAGGAITAILSVLTAGSYSVLPTSLSAEPVTGASLVGATLSLGMTGVWTANAITTTNASATGTAGFARLAANNTAGGVGIEDGDVGTAGTTFIINTTSIVSGGPVVGSSIVLTEA